ncbi:MAG: hypothetical protein PVG39_31310 [Desulfobacteraceae bacterium]|jgi:hypothetical protein
MEQLEIIITRIPRIPKKENYQSLLEVVKFIEEIQETNNQIGFYTNMDAPDDFAFIAVLPLDHSENQKSDLGLFLADAMKNFGLVSYSCWTATTLEKVSKLLEE